MPKKLRRHGLQCCLLLVGIVLLTGTSRAYWISSVSQDPDGTWHIDDLWVDPSDSTNEWLIKERWLQNRPMNDYGYSPSPRRGGGGDPVAGDGDFLYHETDLTFPGEGLPFEFVRTYRSRVNFLGHLGWGWDHNFNQKLVGRGPGIAFCDGSIDYLDGHLGIVHFTKTAAGQYTADPRYKLGLRFEALPNGQVLWTMTDHATGTVTTFDVYGTLATISRDGRTLTVESSSPSNPFVADQEVRSVTDTTGRVIYFIYTYPYPVDSPDIGLLQCLSLSSDCSQPLVRFDYGTQPD